MDKKKVYSMLSKAYSWEFHSIALYTAYSERVSGAFSWLQDAFKKEAEESFGHAKRVAGIASYLGFDVPGKLDFPEIPSKSETKGMLEQALKNEETAAKAYEELLKEVEGNDFFVEHELRHLLKAELTGIQEVKRWLGKN